MRRADEPLRWKGRARMENVILNDGTSLLIDVVGVDSSYLVGFYCDVRGLRVCTTLKRVTRSEIKLRIQIGEPERAELARALSFDQQTREFTEAY